MQIIFKAFEMICYLSTLSKKTFIIKKKKICNGIAKKKSNLVALRLALSGLCGGGQCCSRDFSQAIKKYISLWPKSFRKFHNMDIRDLNNCNFGR